MAEAEPALRIFLRVFCALQRLHAAPGRLLNKPRKALYSFRYGQTRLISIHSSQTACGSKLVSRSPAPSLSVSARRDRPAVGHAYGCKADSSHRRLGSSASRVHALRWKEEKAFPPFKPLPSLPRSSLRLFAIITTLSTYIPSCLLSALTAETA